MNLQQNSQPHSLRMLHADEKIIPVGKNQFTIKTPGARLAATITAPVDFKAVVEPNALTAPGRPGSVDKGDQQVRGERLSFSNASPSVATTLILNLKIETIPQPARQ